MLMASSKLVIFLLFSYHVLAGAAASPFSFSFDFSNRSSYRRADLRFEGEAAQHGELVDLTTCDPMGEPSKNCTGRMSYRYPVPLYDDYAATGQVASFATRFTFQIKAGQLNRGNGMAFFLTGYPSSLPMSPRDNGGRGTNRLVAVEFHTYHDKCDTFAIHVATPRDDSVNATCLPSSALQEGTVTASITFDSGTNMLLASMHLDGNPPSRGTYQVCMQLPHPVKSLLPPRVAVGFSAAAGSSLQLHHILSWSFHSTLATRTDIGAQSKRKPARMVTEKGTGLQDAQPKPAGPVVIREDSYQTPADKQGLANSQERTHNFLTKDIWIVLGALLVGLIVLGFVIWCCCKKTK